MFSIKRQLPTYLQNYYSLGTADQIFFLFFIPSCCIDIGFLFKGNTSGGFGCGDDKDESSDTIIGPSLKERLPMPNESSAENIIKT